MMTIQELISRLNGGFIDVDNAYGNQCTDLAKFWEQKNGWPVILGNAIDEPKNIDPKFYEFITYSTTNTPVPGDLVIFNYPPYGHVSVYIAGDARGFNSFDQNYPQGSRCHIEPHSYKNVVGWIHYKNKSNEGGSMNMYDDPVAWEEVINAIREFRQLVLGHIDETGAEADAMRVKNAHTGGELKSVMIDIWTSQEAKQEYQAAQQKLDQIKAIVG